METTILTLTVQIEIEADEDTYLRKRDKIIEKLEAKGWGVDIASEDVDGDEDDDYFDDEDTDDEDDEE